MRSSGAMSNCYNSNYPVNFTGLIHDFQLQVYRVISTVSKL